MDRIVIYAFGDSFTAGLGVDRTWEESQLGNHPKWDVMSDDEKSKANTEKVKKDLRTLVKDKEIPGVNEMYEIDTNNKTLTTII